MDLSSKESQLLEANKSKYILVLPWPLALTLTKFTDASNQGTVKDWLQNCVWTLEQFVRRKNFSKILYAYLDRKIQIEVSLWSLLISLHRDENIFCMENIRRNTGRLVSSSLTKKKQQPLQIRWALHVTRCNIGYVLTVEMRGCDSFIDLS